MSKNVYFIVIFLSVFFLNDLYCQRIFYISMEGSDGNEGSISFPFRTLQYAIDVSESGDTLLVAPGVYNENIYLESKNIFLSSYVHFAKDMEIVEQTIIDGGGQGSVVSFFECSGVFQGFTLRNGNAPVGSALRSTFSLDLRISTCIVSNNISASEGQGFAVFLEDEGSLLENCIVRNNEGRGSAIEILGATTLSQCTIIDNNSLDKMPAVNIVARGAEIKNAVIARNGGAGIRVGPGAFSCNLSHLSVLNNEGPALLVNGVGVGGNTQVVLMNSILWGNLQPSVVLIQPPSIFSTDLYFDHSIVERGISTVQGNDFTKVFSRGFLWDEEPELEPDNFRPSNGSPALGRGVREFLWEEVVFSSDSLDLRGLARPYPRGSLPDLGAVESPLSAASSICVDPYFERAFLYLFYAFCGQAIDDSGNQNHPIFNTATLGTDRYGRQDQAYFFSSSILQVGMEQDWMDREFTFSGWVKAEESGTLLISNNLSLLLRPGCHGQCLEVNLNDNFEPNLVADFPMDSWIHVALVKRTNVLILYLNGQRVADIQGESDFVLNPEEELSFGGSFRGLWDDIGIWQQAFSDQDVEYLFFSQTVKDCPLSLELNISVDYQMMEDGEGNLYPTVLLGNQTWMASNLRSTRYNNGEFLSSSVESTADFSLECGRGKLYTWEEIQDTRNICPLDWRIPDREDWQNLRDFLRFNGFNYDGKILSNAVAQSLASGMGWEGTSAEGSPSWNSGLSNNLSGFSALPLGYYSAVNGTEIEVGASSFFWTLGQEPMAFSLSNEKADTEIVLGVSHEDRLAVRCIKGASPSYCVPPWDSTPCGTENAHKLIVEADPVIDLEGYELEEGDWIGVFFTSRGGMPVVSDFQKMRKGLLTELTLCEMSASNTKDGFSPEEEIKLKIWSCSKDTIFDVSFASFLSEDKIEQGLPNARRKFQADGISWISRLKGGVKCQEIPLKLGRNFVSIYVEPADNLLSSLFIENPEIEWVQTEDLDVILQGDFAEREWDKSKSYYLGCREDSFWEVCGAFVDSSLIYSLRKEGWNYISFPKKLSQRVSRSFRPLASDIISVMSQDIETLQGIEYFPQLNVRDFIIEPGMGLRIRASSDIDFQFTKGLLDAKRPKGNERESNSQIVPNGSQRYPIRLSEETYERVVVFPPASELSEWEPGDEVAAINYQGRLVGSVVLKANLPSGMVVLGKEELKWKGFSYAENKEYAMEVEGDWEDYPPFDNHLLRVFSLKKLENLWEGGSFSDWQPYVYPNPTQGQVFVDFREGIPSVQKVEIYNAMGFQIESIKINSPFLPLNISLENYPEGLYFVKLFANDQTAEISILKKN